MNHSHNSMIDENPFFLAVRLSRTIDQISHKTDERRVLLKILVSSAGSLTISKNAIRSRIGKERGMRSLDPKDACSMFNLIDGYCEIVDTRMQGIKRLIAFLSGMNNAKAKELDSKYAELMDGFWDKFDVASPVKAIYSGKPVPVQHILKSWDEYSEKWKRLAGYADTLDIFTSQVISATIEQIKQLLYNLSASEKDAAYTIPDNSKSMEDLLLADPLGNNNQMKDL